MAAATRVFDKDEDGFLTVSYEQKYHPKKTGKDVKKSDPVCKNWSGKRVATGIILFYVDS